MPWPEQHIISSSRTRVRYGTRNDNLYWPPQAQPLCAKPVVVFSFLSARFSLIFANALFFATGRCADE